MALFAGISAGVTSLAVNSRILLDLRILDTRISHVMMAGALVADILSLLVFSAILGVVDIGSVEIGGLALVLLKASLFFAVTVFVGMKVFPYVGRLISNAGLTGRTFNFTLVLILALAFGELAEIAGLHAILGAFIAGLFLRENVLGKTLSRDLRNAVQDTSIGMLAPIFFVTAGFQVSFSISGGEWLLFGAVLLAASVGKTIGTAVSYLPSKHGWREALVIGAGMNGRGGVDIILIGIALEMGILTQNLFSILIFMAILTTTVVPVALKRGVKWLKDRDELVQTDDERRGVVLIGAGPLARAIAHIVADDHPVTLVDSNENHCRVCRSEGLKAVHGSALQEQVLAEAGAAQAEMLIAMTSNIEVNTVVAQTASDVFHVPDVHLLQAGESTQERSALLRHLKANVLFGRSIDLEEWDYRISHGKVSRKQDEVPEDTDATAFAESVFESARCLILAVQRRDEPVPFHDRMLLEKGDVVFLICPEDREESQRDRFDEMAASCPVLDLKGINSAEDFFELAAGVLAEGLDVDRDSLARSFLQSETWSSTVVAPGLAVPHILLTGKHPFRMLIARSLTGIHFPGHDEPVHIIFVLVSTREERNFHLRALSAVAQIAQDDAFERRWMTASSTEALREIILGADRRRYVVTPSGLRS
jgi:Kef-type K+ transport system membrane component KefB/Trk K+ transport system NAD-binding subunit/mannitol/fructose-specific phosphotransferase system IIA component (Ntr-type)